MRIILYAFRLLWNRFTGMDIKKFQLPAPLCRKGFIKLPPAVCQAAKTGDIFHTVIPLVAIAVEQSMEPFQKFSRISPAASWFIIIQDDLWQTVCSREVYPDIGF